MDNKSSVKLSICIPTNGVIEWVFPVLDSIYCQSIDESLYEVVITNNGSNIEFEKKLLDYKKTHLNLVYKKTQSQGFLNQVDCFNLAKGEFLKFQNHRFVMESGSLNYILKTIDENINEKPLLFFSNGIFRVNKPQYFNSFNEFVLNLSYYSSWSGGISMWRSDFENMKIETFNKLFPHTDWLFKDVNKKKYIIDDTKLSTELVNYNIPKGSYDFYRAFAIEYPSILVGLFNKDYITIDTLQYLISQLSVFLADSYIDFEILKRNNSYKLEDFTKKINIYFEKRKMKMLICKRFINRTVKSLIRKKNAL